MKSKLPLRASILFKTNAPVFFHQKLLLVAPSFRYQIKLPEVCRRSLGFRLSGLLYGKCKYLGSIRGDPLKGTLLNPTCGSLKGDLIERGSISPRVPLILTPEVHPSRVSSSRRPTGTGSMEPNKSRTPKPQTVTP